MMKSITLPSGEHALRYVGIGRLVAEKYRAIYGTSIVDGAGRVYVLEPARARPFGLLKATLYRDVLRELG